MVVTRYITMNVLLVLALLRVSAAQFPSFLMPPEIEEMLHAAMQGNPFSRGQHSMMPKPFDLGMPPPSVDQEMMRFLAMSNQFNSGQSGTPQQGQGQGSTNQVTENNLFNNLFRNHHVPRPLLDMEPSEMIMLMNMMNSKSHNSPFDNHGLSQNHHFTHEFQQPVFPSLFNNQQQQFPVQSQFQDQNQEVVREPVRRPVVTEPVSRSQRPNNMVMDATMNPRFKGMQTMRARNNMKNANARMPNRPSSDMSRLPEGVLNEPYNSQMGTNSHINPYQPGQPSFQDTMPADMPISRPSLPLSTGFDFANVMNPGSAMPSDLPMPKPSPPLSTGLDFSNIMHPGIALGGLPNMPPIHPGGVPISPSDMLEIMENRMELQLRTRQMQAMMAAFNKPQASHNNQQNAMAAPDSFVQQSPNMEPMSGNTFQESLMPNNIIETVMPNIQTQQRNSRPNVNTNMLAALSENNRKPSVASLGPKASQNQGVETRAAPANAPGAPGNGMTNEMMCRMCYNMTDSGPCMQQFCANP